MQPKFLLFALLWSSCLVGQTFIQAAQNGVTASTAVTVNITTTSGNAVVVWCTQGANNTSTLTITDSASQAGWTQTSSGYASQGTSDRSAIFYKTNSAALTSVTCTWSGSLSATLGATVFELGGIAASSAEDSSVNNSQAATTTATSGSLSTTSANDILLFGVRWSGAVTSPTAGSGYTLPANATSTRTTMQYKIVSAAQSAVTTTLTWTNSVNNANAFAAFKASTATPTGFNKQRRYEQVDR